ncbi:hypothetical protein [Comamonas testosteroni]|uniref:hypothetical protein n=1 Tax=Comamonas testosteroni TaxID=285 RepID=UPI0026ECDB9B|nr:hypothetical protein [Comamonas testosteroni]
MENEERARENLLAKLSLIQAWVIEFLSPDGAESVKTLVPLSALPRSQRAFNAWTSSDLPDTALSSCRPFHKNANSTLLKNVTILKDLRDYFEILKQSEKTDSVRVKRENVAGLHRRLSMEKTLRRIAETELVRARAQAWRCREELKSLRAELESTEAHAAEMIAKLEALLKQTTAERAELANTLSKVVGMRPATK